MDSYTIDFHPRVKHAARVVGVFQMAANRMGFGLFRHGGRDGSRACDASQDYARRIQECLDLFNSTGNCEELLSVINYAALEILNPLHPNAHFESKDSKGSRVRE